MQIKQIKPFTALCFTTETSIAELGNYVRVKANELYQSAIQNRLEISGPIYWIYYGADGRPETRFVLQICLPVIASGDSYQGPFELKQIPPFKCMAATHLGTWSDLHQTYCSLVGSVLGQNLIQNGTCREVYINIDFDDVTNNITEVQMGIN